LRKQNWVSLLVSLLARLADALTEFNKAVQLLPEYAEAHYNLGVAYLQLDKKGKARKQQQILENLNPELAAKLEALTKK